MSFFRSTYHHPRMTPPDVVAVCLWLAASRTLPNLKVSLGTGVAAHLGVKIDDRLEVLWGKDGDAGRLLLQKGVTTGIKLKSPGNNRDDPTGTIYAPFGHLPFGPIAGAAGAVWQLQAQAQPIQRLTPQLLAGGTAIVVLPEDWWQVTRAVKAGSPAPPVEIRPGGVPNQIRATTELRTLTGVPMPPARYRA